MKKIFYLLVGLLLLPSFVKADMAAPGVIPYNVSVTKVEGINVYIYSDEKKAYVKTDKVIPYGTVFDIDTEYEFEKEGFVPLIDSDIVKGGSDKELYYVYTKDLTLTNGKYEVTEDDLGETYEVSVLKDLDIKKGPAASYASTNVTIKAGSKIKIKEVYRRETPWYYVEYNGTKGFVDIYDGTVAFYFENRGFITTTDVKMYDYKTKKEIKTIKAGTKLSGKIGFLDPWNEYFYIEYNGTKAYIDRYGLVFQYSSKFITTKDIKVYETLDDEDNLVTTIPANTIFSSEYNEEDEGDFSIYYEKDNVKGWIKSISIDEEEVIKINDSRKFKANKDLKIYENAKKDSKVVGTIELNTIFESKFYNGDYLVYYEKGDVKGWILNHDSVMNNYKMKFKTTKELNIYDSLNDNKQVIGKLSSQTTFESEYYSINAIYYEKDGIKGWISYQNNDIIEDGEGEEDRISDFILTKPTKLYDTVEKQTVTTTLPTNTKFSTPYSTYTIYYYEKDGISGFIIPEKDEEVIEKGGKINVVLNTDVKLYEDISDNAKEITTLQSGTTFEAEYYDIKSYNIIYYEKDDVKGWIVRDLDDVKYIDSTNTVVITEETKNTFEEKPNTTDINTKEEIIKGDKPKKNNSLYICIGAGAVIALTALVTIILINRNKKKEEEL